MTEDKKGKENTPQTEEEQPGLHLIKAMEEKPPAELVVSSEVHGGLVPRNIDELWRMADWIHKSGMVPKGIPNAQAVAVAIQMGMEVGLSPMQAVQNIAVINGRPAIWGDAALALVYASGKLEKFEESMTGNEGTDAWTAKCVAKRKGFEKPFEGSFSFKEARDAGLLSKNESIWKKYPRRMLQMRARSFALRDGFADVLKGVYIREEILDLEPDGSGTYSTVADKTAEKTEALRKRIEDAKDTPLYNECKAKQKAGLHPFLMDNIERLQKTNPTDRGLCLKKHSELYYKDDEGRRGELARALSEPKETPQDAEPPEKETETQALIKKMETLDWQSLGKLVCPKNDHEIIAVACKTCDSRVVASSPTSPVEICPELLDKLEKPVQGELLE